MERVVYLLPLDREVAVGSESLVAKHLVGKVAKLDVQAQAVVETRRYLTEKAPEDVALVHSLVVFALAVYTSMQVDNRWQQGSVEEDCGEHVGHDVPCPVLCYSHTGFLHRGGFEYAKEVNAMKEIMACNVGQF